LRNTLLNSQEHSQQEAFVLSLKSNIGSALYNYVGLDEAGKASFLATLGLTPADCIQLSRKDADAILSFLDKQNIHFGKSAFVALETLLKEKNITYTTGDLALKAVLVDVFTGVLSGSGEGKLLELSMYSLSKTASTYGLTLYNTKLDFDGLNQAFTETGKAIAHLKNNHFVIVTNIAADGKVSYIERNRGKDGYTWTVSKEDFLKGWTGYAILSALSPSGALPTGLVSKVVSAETAHRVKGSCLPFLLPILGAIFSAITGVATAVVGAISAIVTGISAVLGPIIAGIGQLVSSVAGFMVGIGGQLFSAIQFVGASLLPNIGSWLGGIGSWLSGVGSAIFGSSALGGVISATGFNISGLGAALAKTVVTTALSIGVSKGLESLGVNSTISGVLSSFVTGGVSGIFNNGFSALSFITGGLQGAAIQGVSAVGARLGVDPMLSNVISMAAGSIIGAVGNNISPINGQFNLEGFSASIGKQIMPNITSEFAYYGITKAGELLGIDPRISYLAGVGVRSTISSGISNEWKPEVMWKSVQNGLLRGITSVGLEWGAESLGLSPLVGSLTSAAIAGGIEALLLGQNPVQGIFDTYFRAGTGLLTLGGDGGNNPWLRAAYLSQVIDFSRIVQERGIVNALETYSAGFLHQQTINEIWKQGGIADLLTKPNQIEITTDRKGRTVKRIYTMDINSEADKLISNFIDLSPTSELLLGFREGNVITHCEFVIGPDGKPQLKNGEREIFNPDGSERVEYVENFNLNKVEYIDRYGTRIGYYVPAEGTNSVIVGADGNVTNGKFISNITNYNVSMENGQVTEMNYRHKYTFTPTQRDSLLSAGYSEEYLAGFEEVVSVVNGVLKYFVVPPDTQIFNVNEAVGQAWLNSIEADGRAFWQGVWDVMRTSFPTDPIPVVKYDDSGRFATIDLNLSWPVQKPIQCAADLLTYLDGNPFGINDDLASLISAQSRLQTNTDLAAQLRAGLMNEGLKFVIDCGDYVDGLTKDELPIFYNNLNTTKQVYVGFSFGTVDQVKSWLIPGSGIAEHTILISSQLPPEIVEQVMKTRGIDPSTVTIIDIEGDLPPLLTVVDATNGTPNIANNWQSKYADNVNSDGSLKWNYVKLVSGGNLSSWNMIGNHGAAVQGILNNTKYNSILVNGEMRTGKTLNEILNSLIEQ
jgi:hypothetical protein